MSNDSKVDTQPPAKQTADSSVGKPLQPKQQSQQSNEVNESSWGDRFKKAAFSFNTYFALNYVVNTLLSVAVAYIFETKFEHKLHSGAYAVGSKVAKFTKGDAKKISESLYMGTKGLSLTMGGTMLVPAIKGLEDNRKGLEFKLGHAFDVLQDKVGAGNSATEENLREYDMLKAAAKTGTAPNVSQEDLDRFRAQHSIGQREDGKYGFQEKRVSWGVALLARVVAWGAAFATNAGLERLIGLKSLLGKVTPYATKKLTAIVPPLAKLQDTEKVSFNFLNDLILCVSSAVTTPMAIKVLRRDKHNPAKHGIEDAPSPYLEKRVTNALANTLSEAEKTPLSGVGSEVAEAKNKTWAAGKAKSAIEDAKKAAASFQEGVANERAASQQASLV